MDNRRDFLKKAALLSGGGLLGGALPGSIARAMAINPADGTTYLDAEHVVILMQENRSFDHSFGTLQGVRGFNDPRAIQLPDGNPVWLQKNTNGDGFVPFRLNMRDTKATWMSSLPHSWPDQVDARNHGRYDQWVIAKQSSSQAYASIPLTLGFYNREDIPFYYAFADAFTVCDQSFCSSLTGTTPNRLYLWSGTIREKQDPESYANVRNQNVDYNNEAQWTTFPERLEENGISWKVYQNEISLPVGLKGEESSWLANYTDNPLEWMKQYNVRFSEAHQHYLKEQIAVLPGEIATIEKELHHLTKGTIPFTEAAAQLQKKITALETAKKHIVQFSRENFEKLSEKEKNLHRKAFTTNTGDPDYHSLASISHNTNGPEEKISVPKGDIFHQFRTDVNNDKLPAVSWLVAPQKFSDHPGAPWYGAWYVSQTLDILTKNPEVWKKTIFILCYDENDGYFDHVPPYVVPTPSVPESGLVSKGIDTAVEYVTLKQDMQKYVKPEFRESPIGLGYRVPMVVASPWSRGGAVCSEVFDVTSVLQFLEKFLSHKTGKEIRETNISEWRRAICGDLTSVFTPFDTKKNVLPQPVDRDPFIQGIFAAKNKRLPEGYKALDADEIGQLKKNKSALMPVQEKGTKISRAIPYELYADMDIIKASGELLITMKAGDSLFGKKSAGAPFIVYSLTKYKGQDFAIRNYAAVAGDELSDKWAIKEFENSRYHFHLHGPNGFFREFAGNNDSPEIEVTCRYEITKSSGKILLTISNNSSSKQSLSLIDNAYGLLPKEIHFAKKDLSSSNQTIIIDLTKSSNWYDFSLKHSSGWLQRFAGHIETGKQSETDPFMGRKNR